MRKSLQSIVFAGLVSVGLMSVNPTESVAQKKLLHTYDWGNPDIPYIEQRGFSLGLNLGQTDLWGDVGTKSVIDHYNNAEFKRDVFENMRFMGGLFARYTHVPGLSFRLGLNFGALYATDKWNEEKAMQAVYITDDYYQRYLRNLDVKTNIWEANLLAEIAPLRLLSNWEFSRMAKAKFQPYLLVGVSGFYFNPHGTYVDLESGGKFDVALQPLRTEGQGLNAPDAVFPKGYSLFSYAAVGGIGFKFDIGKALGLGLEYQLRYTFTDYLDDVSGVYVDPLYQETAFLNKPNNKAARSVKMSDRSHEIIPGYKHKAGEFRGDPSNNDMFSSVSIMFYWKIKKRASPWWNTY